MAFEFSDCLIEEMVRFNQSFGIIELKANQYQNKVLYFSVLRVMDFKRIGKTAG
jgi:hypothetical protein